MRVLFCLLVLLFACTRTTNLLEKTGARDGAITPRDAGNMSADANVSSPDARADDSSTGTPITSVDGGIVYCGAVPCVCANGLDDDGDGLTDGLDPECTGPYDADERSFATGFVGSTRTVKCEDCFFDDDQGSGVDACRYPSSCLVTGTPDNATGNCRTCDPGASCINSCLPRTPNGCDCFGCCEVLKNGVLHKVLLNDACSLDNIDNAQLCPRCTPNDECKNPCGECELCPGKKAEDLPPSCGPGGYTCDSGEVCGEKKPCGELAYCQLGCCVPIVI